MKNYPLSFWLLCINVLTFFVSFNMLLPEMNAYITGLGGKDDKWMILGLWTLAALIMRPLSGKIADNISRKLTMYIGIVVSILVSFAYPYFQFLTGFLVLRFIHGMSTGFHPTGATALVADYIPKGKRGQAMGIYSAIIAIGFSSGMALGSPIKIYFGIETLFYISGLLGLLSLITLFFIKEDFHVDDRIRNMSLWKKIIPNSKELLAPEVFIPAILMLLSAAVSGVYLFAVPEYSEHLGIENKGLFYAFNLAFVILTRIFAGKFVDIYGPYKNLLIGLVLMIVSCVITGTSYSVAQFLFSSIIYGIASSILSPALFTWTADMSNPDYKGRGMATLFLMLEAGILLGAFLSQVIYNNQPEKFIYLFGTMAAFCTFALIFLIISRKIKRGSF